MPKEYRIKLQLRKPNPLFELWLQDWLNEAIEKNSLKKYVLASALESLKKYPLVLHSGTECIILEGFGIGICKMLDKQLVCYNKRNPEILQRMKLEQSVEIEKAIKNVQSNIYSDMAQENLQQNNASTTNSEFDDSILELYKKYDIENDNLQFKINAPNAATKNTICMSRNTYDIILLVDTQETSGKTKRSLDATVQALQKEQIKYEVKRLSAGDFLWICRQRNQHRLTTNNNIELILPYIIERKRMDDLASSIRDGRFHEQKFRLKDSRIQNVIYLIEDYGTNKHLSLPLQNLLQSATNTEIHNKFSIKFTNSHSDSMLYLSVLTKLLIKLYCNKDLIIQKNDSKYSQTSSSTTTTTTADQICYLMDFNEFQLSTKKMSNFKINDLFLRQLLQLKSLSIDKAIAIVKVYPTPNALIEHYKQCKTQLEAENLLTNIKFGKLNKTIGLGISKIIYQFYNS